MAICRRIVYAKRLVRVSKATTKIKKFVLQNLTVLLTGNRRHKSFHKCPSRMKP